MRTTIVVALVCGLWMGCSKSSSEAPGATAPEATTGAEGTTPPEGSTATTESTLATQPEATKVKTEITKLTYPATREQILAAAGQSPDFTESEKKYMMETLPAGNYGSAEEVLNALKLQ